MAPTFILVFFLCLIMKIQAMEQSVLHRNLNSVSVGNFRRNQDQYLWVERITSSMVADNLDCTFLCINNPNCFSFNMAAYPDVRGRFLCELLSTDKYNATDKLRANVSFHHFSPWSPCEQIPCKNSTDCVPDYEMNSYVCVCKPGTGNKTCSHIRGCHPTATSGSYLIDPDQEGGVTPFTVYCDMSTVGVTVVSHDSETRTAVNWYAVPGTYSRDVHYSGASFTQLASLIDQSSHCEQFIKYECLGSKLLNNGQPYGWWKSRDGSDMTYWGGVTSSDFKCACGLNNSCADPSYGCNCDKGDREWREDKGLLTKKSDLPVSQLRLDDSRVYYYPKLGFHTLGKLRCYGMMAQ